MLYDLSKEDGVFFSIQGEGIRTGELSVFIRMYGCNLDCEWCDTKHSHNKYNKISQYMSTEDIIEKVKSYNCKNIVITGGEPTLQNLNELISTLLLDEDVNITIETNGTMLNKLIGADWILHIKLWSISPKIYSKGKLRVRFISEIIKFMDFAKLVDFNVQLKLVISSVDELKEFLEIIELLKDVKHIPIIFQPEASNYQVIYRDIVEYLLTNYNKYKDYNIRVMLQTHRVVWGDRVGV